MSINSCTGMESGVTFVLGAGELMSHAKNIDLDEAERDWLTKNLLENFMYQ